MATVIPIGAPAQFIRGDTVKWRERSSDYPPGTWSSELALASSNDHVEVAGSDYGDGTHLVALTPAQTAALLPGVVYTYQVSVTDGTDRYTIARGAIKCVADVAAVSGGLDDRSPAAIIYDAILALMQGKATSDQQSLSIDNRSLSRYSWEELSNEIGRQAHRMTGSERLARGMMPRAPRTTRFAG